jgi:hypothetical protein
VTLADDVTALLAEARSEMAEAFHADGYELLRAERVESDGRWVQQAEIAIESGRCALLERRGSGGASVDEQVIAYLSAHAVELPAETAAEPGDAIRINGRRYLIESVQRGGNHRLFAMAAVQERA